MPAKVSVIVPIHGVERYIERCARSLFAQTVTDLQFVFVDDCSPDNSIEVLSKTLEDYPQRIPQTLIHRKESNEGVIAARADGLRLSDSEYVAFVDADDFLETDAIEALLAKAEETGADMTICGFNKVCEDGTIQPSVLKDDPSNREKYLGYMVSMISRNASPNIFNKLFRRELLQRIPLAPKGHIGEDWVLCVQATHLAAKIATVDRFLYNYVVRDTSITHAYDLESSRNSAKADMANIDLIVDYLEKEGLSARYRKEIAARKYVAKGSLNCFCEDPQIHKEWKGIYSEINRGILFNPCLSTYDRKSFLLRWFRLGSKYYRLVGSLKNALKIR